MIRNKAEIGQKAIEGKRLLLRIPHGGNASYTEKYPELRTDHGGRNKDGLRRNKNKDRLRRNKNKDGIRRNKNKDGLRRNKTE